jgi:hypothetical protein
MSPGPVPGGRGKDESCASLTPRLNFTGATMTRTYDTQPRDTSLLKMKPNYRSPECCSPTYTFPHHQCGTCEITADHNRKNRMSDSLLKKSPCYTCEWGTLMRSRNTVYWDWVRKEYKPSTTTTNKTDAIIKRSTLKKRGPPSYSKDCEITTT